MSRQPHASDGSQEATAPQSGSAFEFLKQAFAAYEMADHDLAERILVQVTEQRPDDPAAWHLRGLNAAAAGATDAATRFLIDAVRLDSENAGYCATLAGHLSSVAKDEDALIYLQRAADLDPSSTFYRTELAFCLSRLGRHQDALPHFEVAIKDAPDDDRLLAAFGVALAAAGANDRAIPILQQAHEAGPEDAQRAFHLALALQRSDKLADAADTYGTALAADPHLCEAWLNRSACRRELGDTEGAIEDARVVLATEPGSVSALTNIGAALCDAGQHAEAIRHLAEAIRLDRSNISALHNLGVALHGNGYVAEAEACLKRCLSLEPKSHDAQRSLANLCRTSGRLAEAAELYRAVTEDRPLDFKSYVNLGLVLLNLNRPDDAIGVYEKAAALRPERPEPRLGLGIAQLTTGNYEDGFRNYEARLDIPDATPWRPGHGLPRWTGTHSPVGPDAEPTVLVHAEQGLGDTIQFCRYLSELAACRVKVIFECPPPLTPLLQTLASQVPGDYVSVITPADPLPDAAEFHIPLLSLPALHTSSEDEIPRQTPYLEPPEEKRMRWADTSLGEAPLVGLVWAGNPNRQDDQMRSCPASELAPLLATPGVTFVSLQKDSVAGDKPDLVDVTDQLHDFGDTAALIERLDLVISVDTAVAHLGGAMGKPTWVMLGYAADWRYLQDRPDCPWYPSMRLFRQPESGDWHSVVTRMAATLRSHFDLR